MCLSTADQSVWAETAAGFRYLVRRRGHRTLVAMATLINALVVPAFSLLPLLVLQRLNGGATELGWLTSSLGVGLIVGGMALGAWGLWRGSVPVLLATLFCLGTHSTVFGPIKYALLPQHPTPVWPVRDVVAIALAPVLAIRFPRMIGATRFLSRFELTEYANVKDSILMPRSSTSTIKLLYNLERRQEQPREAQAGAGMKVWLQLRLQLRQLIQASAQSDVAEAQRLAHSMKGATGTVGAVHLTGLLTELERALGDGDDGVGALVVAVSDELDRAVSVLRQLFVAV